MTSDPSASPADLTTTPDSTTPDTVISDALAHAEANVAAFVEGVLDGRETGTHVVAVGCERDPERDVPGACPRLGFTITFDLAGVTPGSTTFGVVMPGLPLDEVTYGAREQDRAWRFPKLRIKTATRPEARVQYTAWWWSFGIAYVAAIVDSVVRGESYPNLAMSRLLGQQYAPGAGRGFAYGYNEGLPDAPFAAAWGCRAIAKQSGMVDIVADRKSSVGDKAALTALFAKLDGGLTTKWKDKVEALLSDRRMLTSRAEEFTVLDEDGVVVKANTNESFGHLYVCAYMLEHPDAGTVGP